MTDFLYKVSPPREDMVFHPRSFWHSADWESSTDRPRAGYIEEHLLYASDLEEISIHLFPRVRTVRVRQRDADSVELARLGIRCRDGMSAYIFIEESQRSAVQSFSPTVYRFHSGGFTRVRRGEYVSRTAQKAVSFETLTIEEAIARWHIEACYVSNLDTLIGKLSSADLYFEEQT